MKLLLLLLLLPVYGQTRISLEQLQGNGTSPKAVWNSRGMRGQHVHPSQVRAVRPSISVSGARTLAISTPTISCEVTLKPSFGGIVQVVYYRGRLALLSGYFDSVGYNRTRDLLSITGPCLPIDTVAGTYPAGINGFLWFSTIGMPQSTAPFRGVYHEVVPYSYAMDQSGFTSVTGPSGKASTP